MTLRAPALRPLLMLLLVLSGCGDLAWVDVSSGPKIPESQWFTHGATVFLSPSAFEQYEEHGSGLLSARFGAGIAFTLPTTDAVAGEQAVSFGDIGLLLRPVSLDPEPDEAMGTVVLRVGFAPLVAPIVVGTGDGTCTLTVSLEPLEGEVTIESTRDLAGHISLVSAGVSGVIGQPQTVAGPGCETLSDATLHDLENLVSVAMFQAVEETLTDPAGFVGDVIKLAGSLLGQEVPGRLDHSPIGPGRFSLAVTPNSVDGAEPVLKVSGGTLVTPLRVGLDAETHPCAAHWAGLLAVKPTVVAPPKPDMTDSDVAISVRRDVLETVLSEMARGGLLCGQDGFASTTMTLAEVVDSLPEGGRLAQEFGAHTPVAMRLIPGAVPTLILSGLANPAVNISMPETAVELYLRVWDTNWLIFREVMDLAISGATPALEGPGAIIKLAQGQVKVLSRPQPTEGVSDAAAEALAERVLSTLTNKLALFALPPIYPYALIDARFELGENHLIVFANLDTEAAPQLAAIDAPARIEGAPSPAVGCAAGGHGRSGLPAALVLLCASLVIGRMRSARS
ncbi:MAG: hypothetical protein ACI9WU_002945 [Myxococcota bacterium]|jgi:hypothetical protein